MQFAKTQFTAVNEAFANKHNEA